MKILSRKAGIVVCLFLFACIPVYTLAQDWQFNAESQQAYDLVLNLQIEEARQLIPDPKTVQEYYVISLAEALELMITEDGSKFSEYESNFKSRIDKKIKSSVSDYQFFHAEARLQWAFVYLKFGHEFDAALNLREAYQIATALEKKSPDYLAIRKTSGLLEVIIGSVPEKYNWVLSLLGMQGSIPHGLHDLNSVRNPDSALSLEADLLYALAQGFVFQKPDSALTELNKVLKERPDNRLALFVASSLAIKNSQSETALSLLTTLSEKTGGLPIYYADYLKGEIYLHKADYLNAISSYRWFLNHYTGQNYIKDAYYKMALCYWLNGNVNDAMSLFKEAKTRGKEASEADKAAARSMADKELPHVMLSKVRFFTDGGYYQQAQELLATIADKDLTGKRNQVEYYYRKARLSHKTNQLDAAKLFYNQTIDSSVEQNWYFAPNACLQLGYIYLAEGNKPDARRFFEKALSYKQHEYKNSIDSKAKSALGRLR
jgi:tetratricopeptide (TPR) repeat protein